MPNPAELNSAGSSPETELAPYKGLKNYEPEDSDLFFGRDREADQLLSLILSSPFTLLHAQSGAGKTSLLNARILPGLESRGWTAIRVTPQAHPVDAVRQAMLDAILPPAEAERIAIERALQKIREAGENPTLGALLEAYDALIESAHDAGGAGIPAIGANPEKAKIRRELITPLTIPAAAAPVTPLFFRLLRQSLPVSSYAEHLRAILAFSNQSPPASDIYEDTSAGDLIRLLADDRTIAAYKGLRRQLHVPVPQLWVFFENLLSVYATRRSDFGIVLILDQFEELFTRFAERSQDKKSESWRLRWNFLEQLELLYCPESRPRDTPLPITPDRSSRIRYVISIRDEYIAQLDPVRRFVRNLDASAYHLSFLEKQQARACIQKPALAFGYDYSEECYADMMEHLVREDRFVEPAQLQIVCDKLWRLRGRQLALAQSGKRIVTREDFPKGGTKAILDSFFTEFLGGLNKPDQLETLELLERLVTSSGTRNILERRVLAEATFRDTARREELLEKLQRGKIVRIETRLGGEFVEITHEFLIDSILDAHDKILAADAEYRGLRAAVKILEQHTEMDFKGDTRNLLDGRIFKTLNDNYEHILWNEWAVELMFRTVVAVLPPDRALLATWARRYVETGTIRDAAAIVRDLSTDQTLGLEELAAIDEKRAVLDLNAGQVEIVLRNQLLRAGPSGADSVRYWTLRL